jgi:AcrR family transcriptional regulator
MANYTQKAILQTFEDMLSEMPFDRITVSAIVSRCEISSNTFYYHYRDIYDLLEAWMQIKTAWFLESSTAEDGWQERLKSVLHQMQENPQLVYHVFNSISRERLERYIFNSVENAFYTYVKSRAEALNLQDEALHGIAGFCCYSLLGFLLKFIWNHMDADVDAAVDGLSQLFDGAVEYVIRKALENSHGEEAKLPQ